MKRKYPSCLRVMADYGSSGIWVARAVGPFRHGMIAHRKLGLPRKLAKRFEAWIGEYSKNLYEEHQFDVDAFNAEGRALAVELKRLVGKETTVLFAPEAKGDDLAEEEEIEIPE